MHFKPMYLCGWFLFDASSPSFRSATKIDMPLYSTREDAKVLAAIYNRIYSTEQSK